MPQIRSLCVYCGSSGAVDEKYRAAATELGEALAAAGSELVIAGSMHDRKRLMAERADAFAVLPGGTGTLDETFEILTWRQLGLHDKPIFLVDVAGYWRPLIDLLEHIVARGF